LSPDKLLFAPTHEWVSLATEGGQKVATVGISAFAVEQLTDLVYLELPKVGRTVAAGDSMGEIESVKAVSDIYAPIGGEIVAVNKALVDNLEIFNKDPYGDGWIAKIKVTDESALKKLLDYAAYQKQAAAE
jgi:glycine cleavage system H protein